MDLNPSGPPRLLPTASPFLQTSSAPDPDSSGTQPVRVEARLALTCVPRWGVTLLGLAQPPLVPGVGEVNEQDQLDEDEEEGAHDAKVEPDCEEGAEAGGWGCRSSCGDSRSPGCLAWLHSGVHSQTHRLIQ